MENDFVLRINFLAVAALAFLITACTLTTGARSTTEARLRRVSRILEACTIEQANTDSRNYLCIEQYFEANKTEVGNIDAILVDGYGRRLVVDKSLLCAAKPFCGPYSLGENGIDECGAGEDVRLTSCPND